MPIERATLSVIVIARDEERHIAAALASVAGLADTMLVLLDQRTNDRTAALATAAGASVVLAAWRGFPRQRNYGLELASTDWVLFLDADERVTSELAAEIEQVLAQPAAFVGYTMPRHNRFFGKVVRGGGWYPDRQLRLLRRGKAQYTPERLVHETVELAGPTGALNGHLDHLNIEEFGELWRKQRAYAIQEAQTMALAGRRARLRNFVGAPAREFVRRYIELGGWRDGAVGLLLCGTLALFEIVAFAHLWALNRAQR